MNQRAMDYKTKRLIKEFPTKGWKLRALNKLPRKLKDMKMIDGDQEVGNPTVLHTASNIITSTL